MARVVFEAMLQGRADVAAGLENEVQVALAQVTPAGVRAEQHRRMAAPGTGTRP